MTELEEKSIAVYLERNTYDRAMKEKQEALKGGEQPTAHSEQSWFSMLVNLGMNVLHEEKERRKRLRSWYHR